MRILLTSAALLLATVVAASAQAPLGAGVGTAGPMQTYDVPMTGKPQTVYILHRVLKPGETIGLHTHEGVEITQVLSGDFQLTVNGVAKVYHAGDSFLVPRGAKHDGKDVGTTDAAIAVTYVLDKGAPLRTAAQ